MLVKYKRTREGLIPVVAMTKVFNKWVKHQGQGHEVKICCTNGKVKILVLIERSCHKHQSPSTSHSKVIIEVEVFNK